LDTADGGTELTARGSDPRGRPSPGAGRVGLICIAIGLLVVVLAEPLASLIGWVLPGRAQIRSTGSRLDQFAVLAPTIIRRSGAVLAIAGVATAVVPHVRASTWWRSARSGRVAAGVVIVGTACWYAWLAEPHNAFPPNSRFHWVDYLTWDSDHYGYAAGRLPHLVFYEVPYVWQGINAGLVAWLCYLIGRRLGNSTWLSAAMATLPALASNLLIFADTSEDVMLNTLLLLFVVWAALVRRPVLAGSALALAAIGRPSFIILIPCFIAAELLIGSRLSPSREPRTWRYLGLTSLVAIALTAALQLLFSILGDRHFIVDGQFIRTSGLDVLVPRRVDGFLIAPFSGVYAGHVVWIMPFVFLVGAAWSLVTSREQPTRIAAAIYLSGLFVVSHVLLHEARPLGYFNARYLAYVFPFLFFMSWGALRSSRFASAGSARTIAIVLLVLGPTALPANPIEVKRRIEARPEVQLLEARDELRELTEGRPVFLNFGDVLSRDYLAYVLRRNAASIRLLDEDLADRGVTGIVDYELEYRPGDVVISLADDPWDDEQPDLVVGDFIVTDGKG
jgi:hypothetical protein